MQAPRWWPKPLTTPAGDVDFWAVGWWLLLANVAFVVASYLYSFARG